MKFNSAALSSLIAGCILTVKPAFGREISSEFLDVINMSMRLSTASFIVQDSFIEEAKTRMGLDRLEVFQDGSGFTSVSSNLVAKHNEVCYGVFRGTVPINPEDMFQNADIFPHQVGDCSVHGGLDDNYVLAEKGAFDFALADCVASCASEDCPLVLTGISQGGGTAAVAQLYWTDYDPTVITFGAPAPLYQDDCYAINPDRNFRFWSTQSIAGVLTYDSIVNLNLLGYHYGHAYLLFDDALPVYLGLNDRSERYPTSLTAHGGYQGGIKELMDKKKQLSFPLTEEDMSLDNFEQCGYNDECKSGKCGAFSGTCEVSKSANGEACNEDSDCQSGICAIHNLGAVGICTSGERGDVCVYHDDCYSGYCSWYFQCA